MSSAFILRRGAQGLLTAYAVALPIRGTASLQAALLLSAFALLLFERRRAWQPAWAEVRWVLAPLLIFSLWIFAVCGFWREPPLRSWDPASWSMSQPWFSLNLWRRDIVQPMIALLCAYWAFRDEKAKSLLFLFQGALILVFFAKGLQQFYVGEKTPLGFQRGTFQVLGFSRDNIFFSYVLFLLTPAAIWRIARPRGQRLPWFSWFVLLLLLGLIFLNKRRGTWMAIYVEFFILAAWKGRRWLVPFILVTALAGVAALQMRPQWFIRNYDLKQVPNTPGRLTILQSYPSLLRERPITGVGFGKDAVVRNYWERIYQHAHNTFLNVALEVGLPGLALWLAALFTYGLRFWRGSGRDPAAKIGFAFLVAFCVRNLTDDVWVSSNAELFWLLIGALMPDREARG